jgi:hypothetical protein
LKDWPVEQAPAHPRDGADDEVLRWQDASTPLNITELRRRGRSTYRLRMDSELAVDVIPDGPIVVRRNPQISQAAVDHFLADQVIPRLLAHAGSFVFHAGAVQHVDGALVFMGPSGRGKSTLVTSFDQAGMALLGDDAMVLSTVEGRPHVKPVYPSLRLFPDSIEALMPGASTAGPVAHYTTKERIDVDVARDAATPPLPIHALFSIGGPMQDGDVRLRRLSAAQACMTLIESSFALDPADLDQARRRLDEAGRLANSVPAFEIAYPRDYARLPDVRQAILDQAAELT